MTPYSPYFQRLHAAPLNWLHLFEELSKARSELPKSTFRPSILRSANEPFDELVGFSLLRDAFKSVSNETVGAAGQRFQDGHWPQKISDEAVYFLRMNLTLAMQTIAQIAPTPEQPLKPTIVPFPEASVSDVALWFTTEWWLATGGKMLEIEICRKTRGD